MASTITVLLFLAFLLFISAPMVAVTYISIKGDAHSPPVYRETDDE